MIPAYSDYVFINCPFDFDYSINFESIIFSVYHCGFYPISALGEDNALENRLSKIQDLIRKCRFGIHDISRTELNSQGFPRFNMPFELGIFFGAKRYGNKEQKSKNALIFERDKFNYQNYLSDLNGIDTKAHNNDPKLIIRNIRDWLHTSSKRSTIPGHLVIIKNFERFETELPSILTSLNLERENLTFNDLCMMVEEFLKTVL